MFWISLSNIIFKYIKYLAAILANIREFCRGRVYIIILNSSRCHCHSLFPYLTTIIRAYNTSSPAITTFAASITYRKCTASRAPGISTVPYPGAVASMCRIYPTYWISATATIITRTWTTGITWTSTSTSIGTRTWYIRRWRSACRARCTTRITI